MTDRPLYHDPTFDRVCNDEFTTLRRRGCRICAQRHELPDGGVICNIHLPHAEVMNGERICHRFEIDESALEK